MTAAVGPQPHETARAYLLRTPHQFSANQVEIARWGRVCQCHLEPADPLHLGSGLLDTDAYLGRVAATQAGVFNRDCADVPRDPLEMPAMAGAMISWRLDPTVWKRAWLGRCSAEMWCVEIDGETGWAVFGPGPGVARDQGTAPTPEEAQSQAEQALRAVYVAASSGEGMRALVAEAGYNPLGRNGERNDPGSPKYWGHDTAADQLIR